MSHASSLGELGLSVRACGPEDREAQARLFRRCFKKPLVAADLAWRYDENPHGGAYSVLAEDASGTAACGFAYSPRLALSHGREETLAPIGQQGDVMTDPDWRRKGLASLVAAHCEREIQALGWPLNWGFPNRQSAPVFTKLGWHDAGRIRPYAHYFEASARARAERLREGRLPALMLPLAVRRCRAARARLRAQGAGHVARALDAFPAEVGALSREVEARYPFMVRREQEYLDWRFLRAPARLHRALGVYDAQQRFQGYAVVQLPREGEACGYLVDLLARDESARACAVEAALALLETRAALVRAWAVDGSEHERVLRASGFLAPKPDNHLYVYVRVLDEAHPLAQPARDASRWYLTDGDRDDETMG
jgi:GNAT superfamily N-acetyltransferase